MRKSLLLLIACSGAAFGEVSLETIMADPDWIGNSPEGAFWADDSRHVHYRIKREGEIIRDAFRVDVSDASVSPAPLQVTSSNTSRQYNAARDAVVWVDNGDVFWRRLPDGEVRQLTQTTFRESQVQFVAGHDAVSYRTAAGFVSHSLESGAVRQLADIQFKDDPDKDEGYDTLRENQRRIYESVVEDRRRADARSDEARDRQAQNVEAPPLPIYVGKAHKPLYSVLSPDARFVVLITEPANHKAGGRDVMPNYVTESGYTETRQLRTRVGRNEPTNEQVWLVDLTSRALSKVDFSELPGIDEDPLSALREGAIEWHVERGADRDDMVKRLAAPEQRAIGIEGVQWAPGGARVALQIHSIDNKDRWLVTVEPEGGDLTIVERLSDEAWINYAHNDFGWTRDGESLWYLSEASGYSHLYVKKPGARRTKALTEGSFVVETPTLSPDGEYLYFRANVSHPSTWEIYRVAVGGGEVQTLTTLGGVNDFVLSPDGLSLLVIHSEFDRPEQLYVSSVADASSARPVTDTLTDAFKAIDWVIPEIIEVPSSHVDAPIYSKLYLPRDFSPDKTYPAVMFVHGAGYTQNAHAGWPYYFREFMFHTLLADRGVIVLDMDYRASKGYGRDWRTAIYRQMGHPELEDFQDGVRHLVENYGVDPERVGVYGGSYGGFMAFMALFRDPDLFAAGAALRPVVDWAHYNHGYTANILNTPLIDPEAYEKSSPIFFAEGLSKPLLIAAGMQDDNVFFQDSVLLVQRLIELQKEDFEIAIYPLDPHGFTHADSWLDEYRRILKLMERYVIAPQQ